MDGMVARPGRHCADNVWWDFPDPSKTGTQLCSARSYELAAVIADALNLYATAYPGIIESAIGTIRR